MTPEEDSPLVQRIKKRKLILSSDSEEGEAPFFTSDATPEICQSSPSPTRQFAFFSPLTAPSPSSAPTQPPSPPPCSSSDPSSQSLNPTLRRAVTQKASPVFDGHKPKINLEMRQLHSHLHFNEPHHLITSFL
ncbi:hypothetical protein LOTGIDRAFT_175759 [Lottia gigantea]|uniref:Uncharacterized protein n=1 Tax=Lottia gigantea TaxID=225164 RepID=V4BS29_LOTGI|nr:hypothetical protein LOTGIDRAFT_175759 [Lottia gigantea]XP_009059618.1 hypothetical protein LOTGIDRAFT_175848 [Lottia gigantea]ESO89694.1 hypothetical protein LOTGIDRAFT_175848 [Lottia gigantea]ESO91729.1 hypothetical protein LOTGIDRAFT_175759 [Lottia gigantea]